MELDILVTYWLWLFPKLGLHLLNMLSEHLDQSGDRVLNLTRLSALDGPPGV